MASLKRLFVIIIISILLCGCVSIDIHVGDSKEKTNNKKEIDSEVKETKVVDSINNTYDTLGNEAESILNKNNINTEEESKVKEIFNLLTDFLFNDGEIGGHTFKELTIDAKSKCYDMYIRIKNKIEEKYPEYKEKITENKGNLEEKLTDLKNSIMEEYRNFVGEEQFEILQRSFESDKSNLSDVYDVYKPYIDSAKEKAKDAVSRAKSKISDWISEEG